MPVGFSSAARNLFLLGSSGGQVVTNFFKTIDQSAGTDGVYLPDEIKFNLSDEKYLLAGSAQDSSAKGFGWFEKRDQEGTAEWDVRVEATTSVDTTLRAMELDANDNLIVVGKTADIPWIAKYSNGGVIDWQSTTNSADVEYTGITSDSNGNYYACGNTPVAGEAQAFVEKFDGSGNPGWGKSAFMLGRDVVLNKVAANTRGEVVAVGYLEDNVTKGYIVKIDTTTGEVLWDRTINDTADYGFANPITELTDVYIDSNDQIYVVGSTKVVSTKQFIIKYTAEGNIIWQRQSSNDVLGSGANIVPVGVKSDGETEQTIVAARYTAFGFAGILLSKYGKAGDLVWRRMISTDFEPSQLHSIGIDADPSFYYFIYSDETINVGNGTPDQYTFGKVSTSGNGLGAFQYQDGTGTTIDYEIDPLQDELGRLSDGSVRNDSSDLITYPFSPNKILFDDLATQVSNKKRQMDSADSFEYSGSPAIRVADFQELNLLGDVYSGSGNWLDQSGKGNDGKINNTWFKLIGSTGTDYLIAIDRDIYGNYYSCGATSSEGQGGNDGLITKWDTDGNLIWQRIIGGTGSNDTLGIFEIVIDNNNNYVYSGSVTNSQGQGSSDCLITKWDFNGNLIWQRILGGTLADNIRSYKVDSSGNLYACGVTSSQGQGSSDALIIKIDPNGNLIWQKILGGSGSDVFLEIIIDENDNIYCFGYANYVDPNADYLLTKWDTDGNLIWQKKLDIPGGNPGFNRGVFNQIDKCIYITGYDVAGVGSGFGSWDAALFKFDTDGNLIWQRIIGGTGNENLQYVCLGESNYLYAVGFTTSEGQGGNDGLITKWDTDGNLIWQRIIGGTGTDIAYSAFGVNEGYFVFTLYTNTINAEFNGGLLQIPTDLDQISSLTLGSFTLAESNLTVVNYSPSVIPISLTSATSTLTFATSTLTVATSTLPVTTIADLRPIYNANGYWEFDGVDDWIDLNGINIPNTSFSLEMWVYSTPSGGFGYLWSDGQGRGYSVSEGGTFPGLSIGDVYYFNTTDGAVLLGANLTANTWYHLLFVTDKSNNNTSTYLDGEFKQSSTTTNTFSVVDKIGRFDNSNNFNFTGRIGEARFYPRALTAAQVFQNYNATREKYTGVPASTDPGLTSTRTPA